MQVNAQGNLCSASSVSLNHGWVHTVAQRESDVWSSLAPPAGGSMNLPTVLDGIRFKRIYSIQLMTLTVHQTGARTQPFLVILNLVSEINTFTKHQMPVRFVFGVQVGKGHLPHWLGTFWDGDIWMSGCYADFSIYPFAASESHQLRRCSCWLWQRESCINMVIVLPDVCLFSNSLNSLFWILASKCTI